jgi:hypothetical protein
MNINDVSKREVLDFDQFKKKVHDETYKPFDAENQESGEGKTGLHKIKREPAYDWVGYADAVFSPEKAGIEIPGYNSSGNREYTLANAGPSIVNAPNSSIANGIIGGALGESTINESFSIKRLKDF